MTVILVTLNLADAISTFYAINVLGFSEMNPLAVGFPIWLGLLKFASCFIPLGCAYVLHKTNMENYLVLPLLFSAILIEFYTFVVAFNFGNIIRA